MKDTDSVTLKLILRNLRGFFFFFKSLNLSRFCYKGRGTRYQIANICWIIKKAKECQKNIYFYFNDNPKAFDCVDQNKLWKILQEMDQTSRPAPWELCMQVKKQQLELDMEQQTGSK